MPWKDVKPMDEKLLFIADHMRQTASFSQLCQQYGISRKTGYKWIERYTQGGIEALNEQSRKRHTQERTPYAIEQLILQLRSQQGTPGPKKIEVMLAERLQQQDVPSTTTIYNILKRAGKIEPRRRARRVQANAGALHSATQPNELWSADYKGQFKTCDGVWCYPLTVMDHASRYLLGCQAVAGTHHDTAKRAFERLFREYGLPHRIRTDNGVPFATTGAAGLSRLSIWWIRLGILPERIAPGKPQQNGRHERMHRTLKRMLGQPAQANLRQQQKHLELFRRHYNEQRPHEGLQQQRPAACYQPSPRPYPSRLHELEYPSYFEQAKVHGSGVIYWRSMTIYVGHLLQGERVGIQAVGDGVWMVHFGPVKLGQFDEFQIGKNNYLSLKV
jgi:transposase InsO family protein